MRYIILLLLLATSALAAESKGPFYDPITGFADALLPILSRFEKASVETTLRGFIARADSFPGYEKSRMEPSELGLYLNVAVRDAEEVKKYSDHSEEKGGVIHRIVQISAPKGGEVAIVIQLDYGREAPVDTIKAIDACISGVAKFSREN